MNVTRRKLLRFLSVAPAALVMVPQLPPSPPKRPLKTFRDGLPKISEWRLIHDGRWEL